MLELMAKVNKHKPKRASLGVRRVPSFAFGPARREQSMVKMLRCSTFSGAPSNAV